MRVWLFVGLLTLVGCAIVPPHNREHLADPTMAASPDPIESQNIRKLHTAREAAGGGFGSASGGGCACSN